MLTLADTVGAQQSICTDELEDSEDGIDAWASLIKHFEHSTGDLRIDQLQANWEAEELGEGEHPDVLYGRLTSIRRQLENLGEPITDKTTTRRFMYAITKQHNHPYGQVVGSYRSQMIQGIPYKIDDLKEFLAVTFKENQAMNKEKEQQVAQKSFAVVNGCGHCGKAGHTVEKCWSKNPELRRNTLRGKRAHKDNSKRMTQIKCFKCGQRGHIKRNCPSTHAVENAGIVATINRNNNDIINCYIPYFVDSGCTRHLVASMNTLENVRPKPATMVTVGEHPVKVTHQGKARIATERGTLILNEAYYAESLDYNLISVPTLNSQDVKATFTKHEAYLEKGSARIPLMKLNGLWAFPVKHIITAAALRIEMVYTQ